MKKVILFLVTLMVMTVHVSCTKPENGQTAAPSNDTVLPTSDATGDDYAILDYYNDDGSFSALGQALDEVNTEKTLALSDGDIFVVNSRRYIVTAETLTLSFYTQSSLADVVQWWTDYIKLWEEGGIISEVR